MDLPDKMSLRLLEWFRNQAKEKGLRIYDDNDGVSIGVDGHINICELVSFLVHGNVTHTPGPPPEEVGLPQQDAVQAALQNLPPGLTSLNTP